MMYGTASTPKKKTTLAMIPLNNLTIKQRFCLGKGNGMHYAPFSLGLSKFYSPTEYDIFRKSEEEKAELAKLKQSHNRKWRSIFGTKRPTNGVVTRVLAGKEKQDRGR